MLVCLPDCVKVVIAACYLICYVLCYKIFNSLFVSLPCIQLRTHMVVSSLVLSLFADQTGSHLEREITCETAAHS